MKAIFCPTIRAHEPHSWNNFNGAWSQWYDCPGVKDSPELTAAVAYWGEKEADALAARSSAQAWSKRNRLAPSEPEGTTE